jgi:hypothetical protein
MITRIWRGEQHSPFLNNAITMEKVASLSCYKQNSTQKLAESSALQHVLAETSRSFWLGVGNSPAHSLASAAQQPISCFRTKK